MKTINILGDSQREQWHSVVNMLRLLGGDLDRKGRSDICDEIDRYIDFCEDLFDEMRREEDNDSRLPDSYAEVEYDDIDSMEAYEGMRFDDMNYSRYMER